MEPNPLESRPVLVRVPPGYGQFDAAPDCPRADYVASPLAMAALFQWDEEDD